MAQYYTVNSTPRTFKQVDKSGFCTEDERMGNGKCIVCGCKEYIMLPEWSPIVQEGGKQYCVCLNCLAVTHL